MKDVKKKLLYRSIYRGSKEIDMVLGGFAKNFLGEMNDKEIQEFEKILELNDSDLYDLVILKKENRIVSESAVVEKLKNFKIHN